MGASRIFRLALPFNAGDLPELDYVQTGDVVYLAHQDYPFSKIMRFGHTDWRWEQVQFGPSQQPPTGLVVTPTVGNPATPNSEPATYVVTAINNTLGQESRPTAPVSATNDLSLKGNFNTISWTAVAGADSYAVYKSDTGIDSIHGFIGETTGTTFVDRNILPDYSDTPPEGRNPFVGAGNQPSTLAMFEQRLILARTRNTPNGIWMSRSADFENMDSARPQRDDDAIALAIASGTLNEVNQIASMSDLIALTSDSAFKITGNNADGYLRPPAAARRIVGEGSSRIKPLILGTNILFWPATGEEVSVIAYSLEQDSYVTRDVAVFSHHMFRGRQVVSWAYQRTPYSAVWVVLDDGVMLCFVWQDDQDVWGWTRIVTDGHVESVACITEGSEDRVYIVVQRNNQRLIERMATTMWSDFRQACFLDSAIRLRAADNPLSVIKGLYHLAGRKVDVLFDGNAVSGLTVSATGTLNLPQPARDVVVGLPYVSRVETLPLAFAMEGTSQTKRQMVGKVVARIKNTRGMKIGTRTLFPVKERDVEPYGSPTELLTGDVEIPTDPAWSSRATVRIEQNQPLPMRITGIFLDPVVTQ